MNIRIDLNDKSTIDDAVKKLNGFKDGLKEKANKIAEKLAEIGVEKASVDFSRVAYVGPKEASVSVENLGDGKYAVIASGETVLVLEFGAGVTYGYGHPENSRFGMGPGTYPNAKGHWDDPEGWWLPREKGGQHTYGNPPSMAMYNTEQEIKREIERVAREVFGVD